MNRTCFQRFTIFCLLEIMSPAPCSYCELVPVRITIGFPPEREPFTTGWGKNFALEKRIYFIDRWITLPHTAASCGKSRVEGGVAKDNPMLQQTDRRCLLSGKEQFIGHIAETEPQKARGREAIRAFSALFRGIAQNHSWYCAQGRLG